MAPHLEIFNYLHLLVLLIWSSDAAMLLKSTSFVNSRKHSIISRSTSAYSGGSRQRQKISMIQRRDPLQNKSSKLDHVRGSEIFDRRYSIGSKVNDRELSRKRSEKCSHLFNEVQPGKYPEDRNDAFAEELMNMRGREIAEAMFMSG